MFAKMRYIFIQTRFIARFIAIVGLRTIPALK